MRASRRLGFATREQVSPKFPYPGIPILQPFSLKPKPLCETTTLPNGLRIVTQETGRASSSLGLFVNSGSRFETDENAGVSHFLEHMAFKSTPKRSYQRLVRDVEDIGAQVGASSTREYLVYTADVMNTELPNAFDMLMETAFTNSFYDWEVDDQRKVLSYDIENRERNAQQMVTEMIYEAAYGGQNGLGRGLYLPKRNIDKLSASNLAKFVKDHYHPSNMILSGAGVKHEEIVNLAKQFSPSVSSFTSPSAPISTYLVCCCFFLL
jgi:predicted Zn-dependent peptidase